MGLQDFRLQVRTEYSEERESPARLHSTSVFGGGALDVVHDDHIDAHFLRL
jgi:hypothetical protein